MLLSLLLYAWLYAALFEGSVDSGKHSHICCSTDAGVALHPLQAHGAAGAHTSRSACRQHRPDTGNRELQKLQKGLHIYPHITTALMQALIYYKQK